MILIHVYQADLRKLSTTACLSSLDHRDLKRASDIVNQRARETFVKGRWLLRNMLSSHTGCRASELVFSTNDYGKPYLSEINDLHFNVSHSNNCSMIAVASVPLGIDIERIDKSVAYDEVAKTIFSRDEKLLLRNTTADSSIDTFFSIWTKKEAYQKALGTGFSCDTTLISTVCSSGRVKDRTHPEYSFSWHIYPLPAPANYKAALAVASDKPAIKVIDTSTSMAFPTTELKSTLHSKNHVFSGK